MNISQLTSSTTTLLSASRANNQAPAQTTDKVYTVAPSLKKANNRLQGLLDSTTANLSTLGKFKASVSDVQLAAQTLKGVSKTSSSDEVAKALGAFAVNFNAMVALTKSVAAQATGIDRISRMMTRAMTADFSRINDLRQIGFTKGADGTLTLDMDKFKAAYAKSPASVQAILSKLGGLIHTATTKELGSDGRITASVNALNSRSTALQLQQSTLLKVSQQMTTFAQSNTGLSAYMANI